MRATNQQTLISTVFEAAERATDRLTHLVPDLDRDRSEYAGQARGATPPSAKPSNVRMSRLGSGSPSRRR